MRMTVKKTNAPLPLYVKKGEGFLTADDLTFDVMVNILL
jgi:hypothetical protein